MLKNDLILRNPIRLLAPNGKDMLPDGGFGAITARAGVGKTAFLVQIALNSQLEGKNVLHISLEDPVKKVDLWYKEVFRLLAEQYHVQQINQLWETILPHRFIMTFRAESFSVPVFDERLSGLIDQGIFSPQMVIIDGLSFEPPDRDLLTGLKLSRRRITSGAGSLSAPTGTKHRMETAFRLPCHRSSICSKRRSSFSRPARKSMFFL
ncbi:hypothetical protein D3OALGB2SA_1993 [Olavius algarvensis associated proteobacterium Delta 3]|nr:hypothetical protein D3OALGB2SA_1993 [Olavius algarvensis associated proteobacterium Delta 3]